MPRQSNDRNSHNFTPTRRHAPRGLLMTALIALAAGFAMAGRATAQQQPPSGGSDRTATKPDDGQNQREDDKSPDRQAELDAALVEMLSGATLEGSFTSTGPGRDPTKLSREKYTLGKVQKLAGNFWLIPARIQYGKHDATLPITVPIEWAGDTPLIVIDDVPLPGFGTVSARVMFFADHYAGYWKHGDAGGHLFGVIRRGEKPDAPAVVPGETNDASVEQPPAGEEPKN